MKKDNDCVDYKEDLKILKKSIDAVKKLNWNDNKKKKNKALERNVA